MKLNQFDYFRAIAILLVVFGHTAQVLLNVYSDESFLNSFIFTLISGATALFVFISGFFFHYVFYQKFEFKSFILKKVKGVYVPYILLTTLTFFGFFAKEMLDGTAINHSPQNTVGEVFYLYLSHIINGSMFIQFWYIPFIMLMFLASPIFISYIKSSTKLRVGIMLLLAAVSLWIHRPLDGGHSIHAFIYYLPIYMFGINCSIHRQSLNESISGKSIIFGALVILIAIIQLVMFDHIGNYQKEDPFLFNGVSLMLIQKVFLILFFLSLLQKYENKESRFLKEIAASSFAIYFLHMLFLQVWLKLKVDEFLSFSPDLIMWFVISSVVILTSYLTARIVRLTFKKNSKLVVGW